MDISDHKSHDKETEQAIIRNIEKYGWHISIIEGDGYLPAFAYTIGLYKSFKHAEIISFGLKTDLLSWMLNHAGDLVKGDKPIKPGKQYSGFLEGYNVQFLPVDKGNYQEYLGYAGWYYNSFDFPVYQLVWPDKNNLYPWEEGFDEKWKFLQKLLDRDADFKFYEAKNLATYTTTKVLENNHPILLVTHEEDGDWQFLCGNPITKDDCKVICLEEIVKLDPSLNQLFDLPYGWEAERNSIDDKWVRRQIED